ncbi:glutathione S-transferase family protein [Oricola sp.]|uniref:glutathione S-transferase family protein n=1 Tax=Oricola sp. TaxID=1979950 RepID=UPI0025FB9077|nr:glutathione S-transferase family protein [Oricola sp.]MCI5073549.1 glutathione S-transferase family protein [Oricola sp.]
MTEKIQFYTNPMSRGQIARWALHEAGADYDEHILGYGPDMKQAYRDINPMGKVPAIVHDGRTVTEAAAICLYLAEAFPDAGLLPQGLSEKADYLRWSFFAAGPVEQAVTTHAFKWDEGLDPQSYGRLGFGNYDLTVEVLSGFLRDRAYVCGDRFTAADIYVGSQVVWGLAFGLLPKRDELAAYAERLRGRDAYKAARAIDDAHAARMYAAK